MLRTRPAVEAEGTLGSKAGPPRRGRGTPRDSCTSRRQKNTQENGEALGTLGPLRHIATSPLSPSLPPSAPGRSTKRQGQRIDSMEQRASSGTSEGPTWTMERDGLHNEKWRLASITGPLGRGHIVDGVPPPSPYSCLLSPCAASATSLLHTHLERDGLHRHKSAPETATHMVAESQPPACSRGKDTWSGENGRQAQTSLGRVIGSTSSREAARSPDRPVCGVALGCACREAPC